MALEILEEIKSGKSLNEMALKRGVSSRMFYRKIKLLKDYGYKLYPVVRDDGQLYFGINTDGVKEKTNTINVKLMKNEIFRAMLISDLHVGNTLQNMRYLDIVYDYCTNNDIHIIINAGDLIDGLFTRGKQNITDIDKQMEYLVKHHPYDSEILNLVCLGNHDYDTYLNMGRDISVMLKNYRYDLIPFGYGFGIINVGNDQIIVKHPICHNGFEHPINKLIICGHKHKAAFTTRKDDFIVNVPTLSDLCFDIDQKFPGAIEMRLDFGDNGYIECGLFKQMIIDGGLKITTEARYDFFFSRSTIDEDSIRRKVLK